MKRIFIFWMSILLLNMPLFATYYYYKGQKIPIVINPDSIVVYGSIRADEIVVETTGADFVFADEYHLRPLSEVKAFIDENKHLPEIQSAQEMQENGVSISELQTQLLQKIEGLPLYILQQEETIQELRKEVEQLKK